MARTAVAEFAAAAGMPPARVHAVRLAVSEAITNVVTHAYNGGIDGGIEVCAAVAGNELWVLISDHGGGLQASGEHRGLGLGFALIALSADNFTIAQRSEGGIELRLGFSFEDARPKAGGDYPRGSVSSAIVPASARFSTTR